MLGFVFGLLAVVIAFGMIIFIHELGHFLAAKAADIRCPQFAIGFGPPIFQRRWRATQFALRLFPLGGYVMMNGEEPGQRENDPWAAIVAHYLGEASFPASKSELLGRLEQIPVSERNEAWVELHEQVYWSWSERFPTLRSVEGNFHDKSLKARFLVISGGVLMNFLATIVLLFALAPSVGVGSFFHGWAPVLSQVVEGSPADRAGLRSGDLLMSVNGLEVQTDQEAFHTIGSYPGEEFELVYRAREGEVENTSIRPLLAVGPVTFEVDTSEGLTVFNSPERADWIGRRVVSHSRSELLSELEGMSAGSEVEVTLDRPEERVRLLLPESYRHPRGQIGVLFGVASIRFEQDLSGKVASVRPESAAEKAGLQPGDRLLLVDSFRLYANNGFVFGSLLQPAFEAFQRVDRGQGLEVRVLRGDEIETLKFGEAPSELSAEVLGFALRPLGWQEKAAAPFQMIWDMLKAPIMLVGMMFDDRYSGQEIVESLQGPIGIMQLIYEVSHSGPVAFLFFLALLNAAIGAFNLLPFPALDGARLVFLGLAGLRGGKAIDPDKEAKVHLVGLLLLLCFVIVVSFGDIRRLLSDQIFIN